MTVKAVFTLGPSIPNNAFFSMPKQFLQMLSSFVFGLNCSKIVSAVVTIMKVPPLMLMVILH